jgi:hypothetical protein
VVSAQVSKIIERAVSWVPVQSSDSKMYTLPPIVKSIAKYTGSTEKKLSKGSQILVKRSITTSGATRTVTVVDNRLSSRVRLAGSSSKSQSADNSAGAADVRVCGGVVVPNRLHRLNGQARDRLVVVQRLTSVDRIRDPAICRCRQASVCSDDRALG